MLLASSHFTGLLILEGHFSANSVHRSSWELNLLGLYSTCFWGLLVDNRQASAGLWKHSKQAYSRHIGFSQGPSKSKCIAIEWGSSTSSPQVRRHGESQALQGVLEPDDVVGSLDVGPDRRLFGFMGVPAH